METSSSSLTGPRHAVLSIGSSHPHVVRISDIGEPDSIGNAVEKLPVDDHVRFALMQALLDGPGYRRLHVGEGESGAVGVSIPSAGKSGSQNGQAAQEQTKTRGW